MKFVITGTDANARAELKTNLEKQNTAFEASLNSLFNAAPRPAAKPVVKPAEKPVMSSTGGRGMPLGTDRNRRFKS